MRTIYLDHTATTPLDERVYEVMKPYFTEKYGNASSLHNMGREVRAALDESREVIATMLGAHASEIVFVSGGTEANNHALRGISSLRKHSGKNHILISSIEHASVLETSEYLSKCGFEISFLAVDQDGTIIQKVVEKGITTETGLLSIMHANNEIGTINPIAEVARMAHDRGVIVHSDAVQTFGKIPINVDDLGVDLLSISAHKIYGPKGIGALYIRSGIEIDRLLFGGRQERGRRAGTENVALAVGFAKAAELICKDRTREEQRLKELQDQFRKMLEDQFSFILFNGHPVNALSHIVNISFDSAKCEIDGEALLYNLDLHGIAASSGSACSSGTLQPSHVLQAIGRDEMTARASIRFSMGRSTTVDDLEYVVSTLAKIVERIGHKK